MTELKTYKNCFVLYADIPNEMHSLEEAEYWIIRRYEKGNHIPLA